MINWKAHPFLRLILPLIVGILIGNEFQLSPTWYILALPFFFLPILFRYVFFKMAYRQRSWYGVTVNLFLIAVGFALVTVYPEIHSDTHFSRYVEHDNYLVGMVSKPPTQKSRLNAVFSIRKVVTQDVSYATEGHLYASFPDTANIEYGQLVALHITPRVFSGIANPYGFDFKAWQYYQNVHYQAFVKEGQWKILEYDQGNPLLTVAYRLRKKFQKVLHRVIKNTRDVGVASALVLGVKDDLSDETKEAFSSTGAMHVLAVSGLHVGIVSVGLRYLMIALLGRAKARRWWRLIAQLLGVWFFVILTGAGASVMRAGVMFSIVEIGLASDRKAAIFNSIAASAFVLLIFNPFLLFQVGFQLSYLALSGIVFFQPYVYKLLIFESSIVDYIWKLGSVSIAAQLSTFPIGVYYFHHFPLSFFLSGLVVVPAATILLPFTIFVFLIDAISSVASDFVGKGLAFLYHLNTEFIFGLSGFEWMKLGAIYFSKFTVLISFGLVISVGVWLVSGRKRLVFYVLGFLTLLSLERNILKYKIANRSEIVFLKNTKVDAIGFVSGSMMRSFLTDSLSPKKWGYATEAMYIRKGIDQDITLSGKNGVLAKGLVKIENIWNYKGRIVAMVPPVIPVSNDYDVDIIYITQNLDTASLMTLKADTIVLGNQVSIKNAKVIESYFVNQNIFVYNVRRDGGIVFPDGFD